MLPGKDMEFESGDYEDVMDKDNEMEDFSRGSESFIQCYLICFFSKQCLKSIA